MSRPRRAQRDLYDWATLIVALLGLIAVVVSTAIAAHQATVTRQEVESAVRVQRPWIKIEAKEPEVTIGHTDIIAVEMQVSLTNVGALPGEGVSLSTIIKPVPSMNREPRWTPDKLSCPEPMGNDWGTTLFPEEVYQVQELEIINRDDAKRVSDGAAGPEFDVLICVDYGIGGGRMARTTARYKIAPVDPFAYGFKLDPRRTIPTREVKMTRHYMVEPAT